MRHFFFDMDGTLTESRMFIDPEMQKLVEDLRDKADVVVVSGATAGQIVKQIGPVFQRVAILAQNGNDATTDLGVPLWQNTMTWMQKYAVLELITRMIKTGKAQAFGMADDLVEDRGCQISYSLIGHNAPLPFKNTADPEREIRRALMREFAQDLTGLAALGVHAKIGGTTCIDFFLKNKGENVGAFIAAMEWHESECVYVGDALFPGGNDESVVGVCTTVKVKGPEDTKGVIRNYLETL